MTIFDVVVNTDDLVVLGPPDVIDLAVSIGQQGNRGATFYVGAGSPNNSAISINIFGESITPIAGDIFINTALGSEYGWLYIYNPKIVGDQWDQILKLQPPIHAVKKNAVFSSGVSTISIPLSDIVASSTGLTSDNFIVTVTPNYSDPVVLTINSKSIVSTNLNINIEGVKFVSSTWSQLNETIGVEINITVV